MRSLTPSCLIATILLTSCAGNKPLEPQTTYIPVTVSCVESVPDVPQECVPPDRTMFSSAKCYLLDLSNWKRYGEELRTVVIGCQ